jgi:hypothetical protein
MRARINGIVVDGTPKELAEFAKQTTITQPAIVTFRNGVTNSDFKRLTADAMQPPKPRQSFLSRAISKRKRGKQ